MRLHDRPLPRFEVSSDVQTFEKEGLVMSTKEDSDASLSSEEADEDALQADTSGDHEKTFEEKVDDVVACVGAQNALREVLFKTLEHCEEAHEFSEVEEFISQQDEFVYSHIIQTPYTLIEMLEHAGGLEEVTSSEQEDEGTAESRGEATEVQDAVPSAEASRNQNSPSGEYREGEVKDEEAEGENPETVVVKTTPEGCEAVRILAPEKRIRAQLLSHPNRCSTYLAVLDFCQTPRTFPEIQNFFKTTPGLVQDVVAAHHKLSPDYYVDKLDKAGALVWRGAWVDTEAGLRALKDFDFQKQDDPSKSSDAVSQ